MMFNTQLAGKVVKFKGNGRKLGYPTANINSECHLDDGVYFGFSELAEFKNHPTLIFIGTPTTLGDTDRRVEAHLIDIPDIDYYGQYLKVKPLHFYRSNKTFKSISELKTAMKEDEQKARHWFAKSSIGKNLT